MRISLFQPSNVVRDNVIFKALAGPRETDLHQRGFDQNPHSYRCLGVVDTIENRSSEISVISKRTGSLICAMDGLKMVGILVALRVELYSFTKRW
jgi:hypothetical protein